MHRLNRTEYANAIRDLLGLEVDAKALLLPDEADEGFDNVAASLALSPAHLERYLAAAREISRLALGDPALGRAPGSAIYKVPKLLEQDVRVSEDLPFGSRGGIAIRHNFPLDGEYVFKVRLRRQIYDYIVGMGHPQQLDLRIDGQRIKRFTVGGEGKGTPGPLTWNGEIVGETQWELYMHAADAGLEVRAAVQAGAHSITVSFVDSPWEPEGVPQPLQVDFGRGSDEQYDGYAAVDALSILGPYQAGWFRGTESRRRVFVCTPKNTAEEAPCAKKIVSTLARRAYRRPVTSDEIQTSSPFMKPVEKSADSKPGSSRRSSGCSSASIFCFDSKAIRQPVARRRLPAQRHRSCVPPVVLSLEQHPRRRALEPRHARAAQRSGGARSAGPAHVARSSIEGAGGEFREPMARLRKASNWLPDPNIFPDFDEKLREAFLQRDVTLSRESAA